MSLHDAILLVAIGLMGYGTVQHFRLGDEFWFSPAGNVCGATGVTFVAGAMFGLNSDDELIVLVAVALALYWFTRSKCTIKKPATKRQSFEQVFATVEVEPIVEPEVELFVEDDADLGRTEPVVEQPFTWQGA